MVCRLKKFLSRRSVMIAAIVALQLLLLILVLLFCTKRLPFFGACMRLFTLGCACYLISRTDNPAYKLSWVALMLLLPELGGAVYLIGGNKRLPRKLKRRLNKFFELRMKELEIDSPALSELSNRCPEFYPISCFLNRATGFPPWCKTDCRFFPSGASLFKELCSQLEKAEKFIFMEYFIVSPGSLLSEIEDILLKKLDEGVLVRIMYDDMGCLDQLDKTHISQLKSAGAEIIVFNRCRPHLNPVMNYRDHRKICVIDGNLGFCGGANISDEYVNRVPSYGHWKDTGIMLSGDGVWNLTLLFISLWDFSSETISDISLYAPTETSGGEGFVQPFGDSPLDELCAAESVLLMSILRARKYIYITTPYLIPDCEMIKALTTAALSGVDVRIITPGVPDKWYVHALSQSFYRELLQSGVRIFEYSLGFIHSKQFVCDDSFAVVGTANIDFRSFYLHFESAVCLYSCDAVRDVKQDMTETLQYCKEITLEDTYKFPLFRRITAAILKPFAAMF